MNRTIQALLDEADDGLLLEAIYDAIEEAWGPCVEEGISPDLRTFLLVYSAVGHASCGGLKCFLHDSAHDLQETIEAFEKVGLTEAAATLRRFAAAFPNGPVPDEELSVEQAHFFDHSGPLFHADVVPELGIWVRARPREFLALPRSSFSDRFRPPPATPLPPPDADGRRVGEWLHRRGAKLEAAEHRYKNGIPVTLYAQHGIPEGPFTLIAVELPYDRRDTAETLEVLARWFGRSNIEAITLQDARIGGSCLATIAQFPSLRRLGLRGARVADDDLRPLAEVKSLEELDLTGTRVTDDGLAPLAALPMLRSLELVSTRVRGVTLGAFHGLTKLRLGHSPIEDGSLSFLDNLGSLTTFAVLGVPLRPKAIERLASLRNLEDLQLWDSGLAEHVLAALRGHPRLRSLNIQGMKLTAASADVLAEIPSLECVRIGDIEQPGAMIERLRVLRPRLII